MDAFVEELRLALGDAVEEVAAITSQIAQAWPLTWVSGAVFGQHVRAASVADGGGLADLAWLDLYLAAACVAHVPAALAALEQGWIAPLASNIAAIDARADFVAEILQQLRSKVLVATEGPPLLATYKGRGPLGGWLRVVATRLALNEKRKHKPQRAVALEPELATALGPIPVDAEAKQLLWVAMAAAIAALEPRQRTLLRLYYADKHELTEIGALYNVHAATVSRWLAAARKAVEQQTRGYLAAQPGVTASLVESVIGHASELEVSLASLLNSRVT